MARTAAKPIRLICPQCSAAFTVVAFIPKGVDKEAYYRQRAAEHDCSANGKKPETGFKDPLKASKERARSR
jgi:hypothetical protein